MFKLVFTLLFGLIALFPFGLVIAQEGSSLTVAEVEAKKIDKRAQILIAYLSQFNSPLQYQAQDFIEAADLYSLDWRLTAAIAGVESTFGKSIPGGADHRYGSYNAWGWGVYGTQAVYFKSWREGIFKVSEGLRKNYFDKGLTNPYSINRMYAASPAWGSNVTFFLNDIERFTSNYLQNERNEVATLTADSKVAAASAVSVPQ